MLQKTHLAMILSTLIVIVSAAEASEAFTCFKKSCGCHPFVEDPSCMEFTDGILNALVGIDETCKESKSACGACGGEWCPAPEDYSCFLETCGCPGAFKDAWCSLGNNALAGEGCRASPHQCVAGCSGGTWCPVYPQPEKTHDCYTKTCGCPATHVPGEWCANWDSKEDTIEFGANALSDSEACRLNEDFCEGTCGGVWCEKVEAPARTGDCYIGSCGCPSHYDDHIGITSFHSEWCKGNELRNGRSNMEFCRASRDNCQMCDGTWCEGEVLPTTASPTPAPTPSPVTTTSTVCCDDDFAACFACRAGVSEEDWCKENRGHHDCPHTCFKKSCGCHPFVEDSSGSEPGNPFRVKSCLEFTDGVLNALVGIDDSCKDSESACGACGGEWCPAPEDYSCFLESCGCPGAFKDPWCEIGSNALASDGCRDSQNQCVSGCSGGTWCPVYSKPEKTHDCYSKTCGCPDGFQPGEWCANSDQKADTTEFGANALSDSLACRLNEDFCEATCGGVWCEKVEAPVRSGDCYLSSCGCPTNYKDEWCHGNGLMNGLLGITEYCRASETNCVVCGGNWCEGEVVVDNHVVVNSASTCCQAGPPAGHECCANGEWKLTSEGGCANAGFGPGAVCEWTGSPFVCWDDSYASCETECKLDRMCVGNGMHGVDTGCSGETIDKHPEDCTLCEECIKIHYPTPKCCSGSYPAIWDSYKRDGYGSISCCSDGNYFWFPRGALITHICEYNGLTRSNEC